MTNFKVTYVVILAYQMVSEMHCCAGDEAASVTHVSRTARHCALLAGGQMNVMIGAGFGCEATKFASQHVIFELGSKPEFRRIVTTQREIVDLWIRVKLVDVVVQISWGVLMIGIQHHAAMGTLENHVTKCNGPGQLVVLVAFEHGTAPLATLMKYELRVQVLTAVLPVNVLLQVGFTDACHGAKSANEVSRPVDLVFSVPRQVIFEVSLLGKHFAANVAKQASRISTIIIGATNQVLVQGSCVRKGFCTEVARQNSRVVAFQNRVVVFSFESQIGSDRVTVVVY